ncbi:MAG: prepilin-type N-terminal cleavage/methylation domain-containing protein [Verrucomicrobiota bacterium]
MAHPFIAVDRHRFLLRSRGATTGFSLPESVRNTASKRAFTLVELLTVMGIIALLIAFSTPILTSGFTGPALTGASSAVASGLEQARSRSLALGNYTGLFVMTDASNPDAFRKFALFEIAELDDTGIFEVHAAPEMLTEWEELQTGVVFATGLPRPTTILDLAPSAGIMGVRVEGRAPEIGTFQIRTGDGTVPMSLHGIVFAPDGSVAAPQQGGTSGTNGQIDLAVVEGTTELNNGTYTLQLPPLENLRFQVVRTGRFSGSVRIINQEELD